MSITWTAQQETMLRELWPDPKLSCTMIAEQIGVTRNSAIGKAARIKLGPKPSAHPNTRGKAKPKNTRPGRTYPFSRKKAKRNFGGVWGNYPGITDAYIPRASDVVPLNITILKVRFDQCKYIAGDDRLCCGHPTKEGHSWCPAHCELVYLPKKERTDAQKAHDARMSSIFRRGVVPSSVFSPTDMVGEVA